MTLSYVAKIIKGIQLFVLCTMLLIPCICAAQPLPDEVQPYDIVIRTSEHFTVRYPKNAEFYAKKTIDYAEYVYGILSQKLDSNIDNITIEIFDRADVYLDYAAVDLDDNFTLYLWPPENILEYPYYGGWFEEQIASRIARILVQRTCADWIHSLSNMILPLWYLDGIANLYTFPDHPGLPRHQGLIRAIVRNAAQNHALPQMSQLMSGYNTWLGNSIGEIYGSAFLNDIAAQYGIEKITEWNKLNGSNLSSIEHNAKVIFGKSWSDLYQEWIEKEQSSQGIIHKDKHYLSTHWLNEQPQIIPNQNAISYVRHDSLRPKSIVMHDLETHKEQNIIECNGQCEHHWSSSGDILYYTTIIKTSHFESETLYALELGSHQPHPLPIPGHIRSFTENNGIIAAVTILNNQPQIYKFDTEANLTELIYTAPRFSLIEGIIAMQDDQWIASYYDPQKKQFDLIQIKDEQDLTEIQPITDDPATEMYPFIMQDNAIGYITESNGFYYLNRISPDGMDPQMLYLHDAAMIQPIQSTDGNIYYTDISAKGMSIAALPPTQLIHAGETPENEFPENSDIPRAYTIPALPHVESEYNGSFDWSVLIPDTYLPTFGTSDASGWYLGVYLENSDSLNHHLYDFYFAWYFESNVFDLELSYKWHRYQWWLSPELGVEQETYLVDTGTEYQHYPLTIYWASLSTGTEYHFPLLDMELSFKLLAEHTKTNDHSMDDIFKQWMENIYDKSIDLHHRWSNAFIGNFKLSHIHDAPRTIPGKTGYILDYQLRIEPSLFGNYTYSVINEISINLSWPMIWRMVDVLSISLMYGVAVTGSDYRYPLKVETGTGFDSNYFGFINLVDFHGIRAGNLIANNHLIYSHLNYSLPIYVFRHNYLMIPLMINRIGIGLVGDWAVKSNQIDTIDFSKSLFGVGGEIYLDTTLLYRYPMRLGFGYERGFAKAGDNAYYLWIGL